MFNPYKRLRALLPNPPLQVGVVSAVDNEIATIDVPGGGSTQARGNAAVGARVFFRDGVIEGAAPDLPLEIIEI